MTDDWPTTPRDGSPPPRVARLRLNGDAMKAKPLRLCVASSPDESQVRPCLGRSFLYTQDTRSVVMQADGQGYPAS